MARPDLLILGSGSTAFAAAIKAKDLGGNVVMVERRSLGGTCVNRGCLPSKILIAAAQLVRDAAHPRYAGLAPARIDVDFGALIGQKDQLVHEYRANRYQDVAATLGIETVSGSAEFIDPRTVAVGGESISAENILIATGSRPAMPPVPGLEDVPFLTSDLLDGDEEQRLTTLPRSLIVVGGGYVAVELAQLFARLGSEVTVVSRSGLLSGYEPDFGHALAQAFAAEGIEVITDARVVRVSATAEDTVATVETNSVGRTLHAERLLIATGRTPNTDDLELTRAGITTDAAGFIKVDARLRTSQSHVWAAGDVIGRQHGSQMATPVGARQGRLAAENALANAALPFDGRVIPRAIFVDPPMATVGLTEAEVRARRTPAVTTTTSLAYVPRASAIHRIEGFVKMIASTIDERILGVHVMGDSAPEIVHEAAMAMRFGATIRDFVDLIHVYPTMSEALKIGAQAFSRDVSKLSCCAE